ncbi:hypothetical protein ABL78_8260 [Leptomonas seymouri]|uniref:Uncharacterized protein n=1 Tax=Leptomonas seymouri TaxID=5684 RepID=A0A0N0P2A5_LEPSE|nr:hypothetical protein ABL78_8260 [Leptomonas seymouri]|eukprot:KPI82726.1 hypothetical protein ABL78_8260 [Leptomonas seymouri]
MAGSKVHQRWPPRRKGPPRRHASGTGASAADPAIAFAPKQRPVPLDPSYRRQHETAAATAEASTVDMCAEHPSSEQNAATLAALPSTPRPALSSRPPQRPLPSVPAASSPCSPPPPTYEEVSRLTAAASVARSPRANALQPARCDVGVGTESRSCTMMDAAVGDAPCAERSHKRASAAGAGEAPAAPPLPQVLPSTMPWAGLPATYAVPPLISPHPLSYTAPPCWLPLPCPLAPSSAALPAPPYGEFVAPCSGARVGGCRGVQQPLPPFTPAAPFSTSASSTVGPCAPPACPRRPLLHPLSAAPHFELPPPAQTHCGFVVPCHVDPCSPFPLFASSSAGAQSEAQGLATPLPLPTSAPATPGRVRLRMAAAVQGGNAAAQPLDGHTTAGGTQPDSRSLPCGSESPSAASRSGTPSSTLDEPAASGALTETLLPQPIDPEALRITARGILAGYRQSRGMLPSVQAELETISSRIGLERQLGVATKRSEDVLRRRQRYLQTRILEWQQRRAQVAQLTVLLEEQVRARSLSATPPVGRSVGQERATVREVNVDGPRR